MGLSDVITIDKKQVDNFRERSYFDPARSGIGQNNIICKIRFLLSTEEIIKNREPHQNYPNRFVYRCDIEVISDNRKSERNQSGKILEWFIPQDVINLIYKQVGDCELLGAEFIVRIDMSKKARRYYQSEIIKSSIFKEKSVDIPPEEEIIEEKEEKQMLVQYETDIEMLEILAEKKELIEEGECDEWSKNNLDGWFDYILDTNKDKDCYSDVEEWVRQNRPDKPKRIKQRKSPKDAEIEVEIANVKQVLNEKEKRGYWVGQDFSYLISSIWALSERPKVVVKFTKSLKEKLNEEEWQKMWESIRNKDFCKGKSPGELMQIHKAMLKIKSQCEPDVVKEENAQLSVDEFSEVIKEFCKDGKTPQSIKTFFLGQKNVKKLVSGMTIMGACAKIIGEEVKSLDSAAQTLADMFSGELV